MLILQQLIAYALTHKYTEENEKFLDECYFDIWGKGEKAKTIIDLWKQGAFKIEVMPVEYIEGKIGDLYHEQDIWDNDRLNLEEIDTLERLVDGWRAKANG